MKRPIATALALLALLALGACNVLIGVDDYQPAPDECTKPADCPTPSAPCLEATCSNGTCGEGPRALGAACSVGKGTTCDGTGTCVACLPPAKVPPSLNTGDGCGGPSCTKCPDGQKCAVDGDCLSKHCASGTCASPG